MLTITSGDTNFPTMMIAAKRQITFLTPANPPDMDRRKD
jgi:hypothetical protein